MAAAKDTPDHRIRVAAYRARRRQQGLRPVQIWVPDTVSAKAAAEAHRRSSADDPILSRYRAALDHIYGDRVARVVLYGSRARGDAHEGIGLRCRVVSARRIRPLAGARPSGPSSAPRSSRRMGRSSNRTPFRGRNPYGRPHAAHARAYCRTVSTCESAKTAESARLANPWKQRMRWAEDGRTRPGAPRICRPLHVAQALVFERTKSVAKRHRGVQNALYRLTKDDAGLPRPRPARLSWARHILKGDCRLHGRSGLRGVGASRPRTRLRLSTADCRDRRAALRVTTCSDRFYRGVTIVLLIPGARAAGVSNDYAPPDPTSCQFLC